MLVLGDEGGWEVEAKEVVLGGVMASVLAIGGFNRGRMRLIFKGDKNPQRAFLRS
jgi:hypothetical protein